MLPILRADQTVSWSVREAGGGTVAPTGTYTAPGVTGTFHVVGTAACVGSKSAVATVTVRLPSVSGAVTYAGVHGGRIWVPAAAVVTAGPGVLGPIDLGMARDGGDSVTLSTRLDRGASAPAVGDTYTFEVTYTDGGSATLQGQVSAVLQPPSPLAPVDPLVLPIVAPAAPVFSWAAPFPAPADAFIYGLWLNGAGASWSDYRLPPSRLSVAYNANGTASPATLGPGTYQWSVSVRDARGNEASRQSTFTVSP